MGEQATNLPNGGSDNWQAKFKTLKERLSYAVMNEEFADTVFLIGSKKERIRCNKLMLCVNSSVFATMLNRRWHSENTEICIPDTEPTPFRIFLKYLYTEEIRKGIQASDAMSVVYLAKKYDVPKLVEKYVSHLKMYLNTGNAATIFQKAKLLQEPTLENMACEYICRNAKRVFALEDYLHLSQENLMYFLTLDELKIDELSLITAVFNWAQEECKREELEPTPENCRLVLGECVELLRFPLLSAEEFTLQVADKGILCDADVIAILKYYSLSSSTKTSELPELIFSACPRTPLFSNARYLINRFACVRSSSLICDYTIPKRHCFQVNRSISVISLGFFGPNDKIPLPVIYGVDVKIQDYERKIVFGSICRSITLDSSSYSGKVFHVEFDTPVKINPFIWYTVSFLLQGPNTKMGEERKQEVKVMCGYDEVTFKFKDAKDNNTICQIPELCFILF